MRFLVYEFVTGGGWWSVSAASGPSGSLFREGRAMVQALAEDLQQLGQVAVLQDTRCPWPAPDLSVYPVPARASEREQLSAATALADWTVVIAPEFDGHLQTRCEWVLAAGGRLLSPGPDFVALAADKQATAEHLVAHGIRAPRGFLISGASPLPRDFRFPAVLKPRYGAGSQGLRQLESAAALPTGLPSGEEYRLEEWHAGEPASVAVLAGPNRLRVLPACRQFLSDDGHLRYLGGLVLTRADWCARAELLARRVAAAFPVARGYWGLDLLFGASPDGADDVVVEVNPRLTTSYLGLRTAARGNLAAAMVAIASGNESALSFTSQAIQFAATDEG